MVRFDNSGLRLTVVPHRSNYHQAGPRVVCLESAENIIRGSSDKVREMHIIPGPGHDDYIRISSDPVEDFSESPVAVTLAANCDILDRKAPRFRNNSRPSLAVPVCTGK